MSKFLIIAFFYLVGLCLIVWGGWELLSWLLSFDGWPRTLGWILVGCLLLLVLVSLVLRASHISFNIRND